MLVVCRTWVRVKNVGKPGYVTIHSAGLLSTKGLGKMCIIYAFRLWLKHRGKVLIQLRPGFHVMVSGTNCCWHGTNKGGRWHVERLEAEALARWFIHGDRR